MPCGQYLEQALHSPSINSLPGVRLRMKRELSLVDMGRTTAASVAIAKDRAGAGPQKTPLAAPMINRDLSLIEFYWRVLEEAVDERQPLLERIKFLSIVSSLIDEFFMIRVAGLKAKAGVKSEVSPDGLTASDHLAKARERILQLIERQYELLNNELLGKLRQEDIVITSYSDLAENERKRLDDYYQEYIFPVLTPQAVDPSHPFPYITGSSLNLALMIQPSLNERVARALKNHDKEFFVRMKIPQCLPRLVETGDETSRFIFIEDLIAQNITRLIPNAAAGDCHFFRITRDADIEVHESEAADLLEAMEENLRLRRFGHVVRLEVSKQMPQHIREHLAACLQLEEEDVFITDGPLNLGDLSELTKLNRPELKDKPLRVVKPQMFNGERSIFDLIRERDILLHHPYMPYAIVTDLIAEAAEDPDVLAIKICLYRMGKESPIPPLLIRASELGKQVTVLIELKARFDEANNIEWAKKLEQAGVHVIYGLLGLKTHAKTTLIVRREGGKLRRYVHAATGNYNPQTSAAYTDLGLLTVDNEIGADATALFNFLTVYSQAGDYQKLVVAPINLRQRMVELIERESEHARNGRPARIIAKLNRLADTEIVSTLYEASKAGVKIDLTIRGICTLRPGVPGMSENITVRTVVGRLLEHSRVYYFQNGGDEEIFIGSSDWMPRNLDRRVEVLTPVEAPAIKRYLRDVYLEAYLRDNATARILREDGMYERVQTSEGEPVFNVQEFFQGNPESMAAE
jgi:polyphosphate kinase